MRSRLILILVVGCVGIMQAFYANESFSKDYWCCCPTPINGQCQCATGGQYPFYEDSACTQLMTDDSDNVPFLDTSHLYLHCVGPNANRPPTYWPGNIQIDVSGDYHVDTSVGENVNASPGQDAFSRLDCLNNQEPFTVTVHVEWFNCFNGSVPPPQAAGPNEPAVFQAAGTTSASIQGTVDAFRTAVGNPNNLDNAGTLGGGRREINWDGGNPSIMTTTPPVTPFDTFLNTRGARFTTPWFGLSQVAVSGGPQNGLVGLFKNPTYFRSFRTFSASRLFTPVGSNITEAFFFVPGTNGSVPATVRGFGAIFIDVDQPDRSGPSKKKGNRGASTLIEYFDANGKVLFSGFGPASPGDANLSFFGIVFDAPLIARVRITAGDTAPGPDDDDNNDIVMMDDFIYGEPQAIQTRRPHPVQQNQQP